MLFPMMSNNPLEALVAVMNIRLATRANLPSLDERVLKYIDFAGF